LFLVFFQIILTVFILIEWRHSIFRYPQKSAIQLEGHSNGGGHSIFHRSEVEVG